MECPFYNFIKNSQNADTCLSREISSICSVRTDGRKEKWSNIIFAIYANRWNMWIEVGTGLAEVLLLPRYFFDFNYKYFVVLSRRAFCWRKMHHNLCKQNNAPKQCDQIWRDCATLAKIYKSLAIFWRFFCYLVK